MPGAPTNVRKHNETSGEADSTVIRDASGEIVWDMDRFAFEAIDAPAPDTVNPSLWRQAGLNTLHGLFKVTDRVCQVRGYDLSNLSIIEGDTGYIVVDPLITQEVAEAAMDVAFDYLGKQRDAYKYINDQTLRLANHGFTMDEIAESIALPDVLARSWFYRGYYGSVNHNVQAVYQLYLGWFDGGGGHQYRGRYG